MARQARAMVLSEFRAPLQMQEFPIPEAEEGQILVKMVAAGVCGSDVHMWQGNDPRTPLPIILGHEGVGEVQAIGGERRSAQGEPLKTGIQILWNRGITCGSCFYCTVVQEPSLCPHRWAYGISRSCKEHPYLVGCYGEYLLLDARTDVFVLDVDDAAMFVPASCSGATAAHAVELCPPSPGDVVLVQGPGPLGIFLASFAREMGASEVIVIGGTPERLQVCEQLGATVTINRGKTTPDERREVIFSLSHGRGADIVYEAAGSAEAVSEGLELVRNGGSYVAVGASQPGGRVTIDCFAGIVRKNLRIQGVWVSHTPHTLRALSLIAKDPEKYGRLITHRFSLPEATEALEAMRRKEAVKAVIVFDKMDSAS